MKKFLGLLSASMLLLSGSFYSPHSTLPFQASDDVLFGQEEIVTLNNKRFAKKDEKVDLSTATIDSEKISSPLIQTRIDGNENDTCSVRFVAGLNGNVVDSFVEYEEIGFNIHYSYNGTVFDYSSSINTIYKSISADGQSYNKDDTSTLFKEGVTYSYFMTYALLNIPVDAFNTSLIAQPYVIKEGIAYTSTTFKNDTVYGGFLKDEFCKTIEFEDANQVELIDNSAADQLGRVSSYSGAHSALVKDLVSYEGEYAPSGKDFVRCVQPKDQMKIRVSSFGGKANLILRGATNKVNTAQYIATATKLSEVVDITLNGTPIKIDSSLKFRGKTGKDEAVDKGTIDGVNYSGRYLYCLWTDLDLGQVTLNPGENEILLTFKSENPGHYDCLKLDYNSTPASELTKVEAEELTLKGNIKVASDRTDLWPDAVSSNNKYVQDIKEEDTMTYTFTASQDGYVQYSIAGASNYCPQTGTSTPTRSYDMYLANVMQLKINGLRIMLDKSLKFASVQSSKEDGSGDRKVLTSYQEVPVARFKVEKGQEYSITSTFVLSGDGKNYKHSYGMPAYGNYDYITIQYFAA